MLLLVYSPQHPGTGLQCQPRGAWTQGCGLRPPLGLVHLVLRGHGVLTTSPRPARPQMEGAPFLQHHTYLRDFCKLSIGLTALLSRFHGNSVVVHKGPIHTQLAGLQGERKRVGQV